MRDKQPLVTTVEGIHVGLEGVGSDLGGHSTP